VLRHTTQATKPTDPNRNLVLTAGIRLNRGGGVWCGCAGQSDAGAERRRPATRSGAASTPCPQSGLPDRGVVRPPAAGRGGGSAVSHHPRTTDAAWRRRRRGSGGSGHQLDADGHLVVPPSQPLHVGHGQHHHRRNAALLGVRAQSAGARRLGQRADPGRRRSAARLRQEHRRYRQSVRSRLDTACRRPLAVGLHIVKNIRISAHILWRVFRQKHPWIYG